MENILRAENRHIMRCAVVLGTAMPRTVDLPIAAVTTTGATTLVFELSCPMREDSLSPMLFIPFALCSLFFTLLFPYSPLAIKFF
jgi:hypothetical protein